MIEILGHGDDLRGKRRLNLSKCLRFVELNVDPHILVSSTITQYLFDYMKKVESIVNPLDLFKVKRFQMMIMMLKRERK